MHATYTAILPTRFLRTLYFDDLANQGTPWKKYERQESNFTLLTAEQEYVTIAIIMTENVNES